MTEDKLFLIIKACFISDLEMSGEQFSRYDCFSEKWKMDIELKCRRKHYDDLMIERDKYDALMDRAKQKGTKAFYINSTPEGIYAFNLDEIKDIKWEMKGGLPRTTDFPDRRKVVKEVGFLSISLAKKINEDDV